MVKDDIEMLISKYTTSTQPNDRYTSFDYCYNYFRTTIDLTKDMEKSCLILGFYLASWGMFRGKSFLLQKSVKHFQPTIEYISNLDKSIWNIDIDNYGEKNIQTILRIYQGVKTHLITDGNADTTLITKILLGVFGFIPAFDRYFRDAFRSIFEHQKCGFTTVNEKSLNNLKEFYDNNKITIDYLSDSLRTKDFSTGEKTLLHYPKAKIIDMYGFMLGQEIAVK